MTFLRGVIYEIPLTRIIRGKVLLSAHVSDSNTHQLICSHLEIGKKKRKKTAREVFSGINSGHSVTVGKKKAYMSNKNNTSFS